LPRQLQLPADVLAAAVQHTQTAPPSFMTFWILVQTFDFRVFIVPVCYIAFVNNI
jgi:hypothetical protein